MSGSGSKTLGGTSRQTVLLAALGVGAVAIGMDTFVVIGVLNEIAASLEIPATRAGQLVSVYALSYAVFAPLSAWLLRGLDRRRVILLAIGFFLAGNLACGLATGFHQIVAGRIVSALGAAIFTPVATALASDLVPPHRKGAALAVIFGGMTVAQAAGIPLATLIGQMFDWRYAFYFVVVLGLVALAILAPLMGRLPVGAAAPDTAAASRALTPVTAGLLLVTFLIVLSEFVVYTYVSVILAGTSYAGAPILPAVLLAYGIGALAGNFATGILTDRLGPLQVLIGAVAVQTALLVALVMWRDAALVTVVVGFVWGIVSYMYLVPIQHRLLSHAGGGGALILSLNSSLIYVGISAGAWLGGVVLDRVGIPSLALVAGALGTVALVAAMVFMRRPVIE
ncbi:MFS transporter [Stappia sp. ES.058]|uniref:MFS transporter n=1 Tax=Stappia sp. ES.058 TaxID=1881061 RepID=UPI0008794227|nr:MFS transporter [Stappia sp. ES.058]SDU46286.1 Predicted arabinose efflux permease, MFS family [Stappia sp. ES.058]